MLALIPIMRAVNLFTRLLIYLGLVCIFCSASCKKKSSMPATTPSTFSFAKGADVSWLTEMESAGKTFYYANGTVGDCIAVLKSLGMNTIRLRVWVSPANGWNNKVDVVAKALRAKNLGMRVMIDFHYSDSWADPGQQTKPAAWLGYDFATLKSAVSIHTTDVLNALKAAGVQPEWVQVGNETNDGMLWPDGKASVNMRNFADLLNAGYDGVKSVFPSAKVILHLSNGYDNGLYRWMLDGIKNYGGKYDVVGLSLYPSVSNWSVLNTQCIANINDIISRYGKETMIVETGMPWDQPSACKAFLSDLITKAKAVPANKCLGLLYWEPESYGGWQGYTLGAFDNSGRPTGALDAFE